MSCVSSAYSTFYIVYMSISRRIYNKILSIVYTFLIDTRIPGLVILYQLTPFYLPS